MGTYRKANQNVKDIKIRFEIYSQSDTVVGAAFSDKGITAQAGEYADILLSLPTSHFAPGIYKAIGMAYEVNEFGTQTSVDRVEPALIFEINNPDKHSIVWLTKYWGHVKFDDMTVKNITIFKQT